MPAEWFVQRQGELAGPYTARTLRLLAAEGTLDASDLVRKGANGNPVPAARLKGLFDALETRQPPQTQLIGESTETSDTPQQWYYARQGARHGPVSNAMLKRFATCGKLARPTLFERRVALSGNRLET